jgi:hypothetical protein
MNYGKLTFRFVFSKLWETTDYIALNSLYITVDIFQKNYKNLILFFVKINLIYNTLISREYRTYIESSIDEIVFCFSCEKGNSYDMFCLKYFGTEQFAH